MPKKIIIVDDSEENVDILQYLLEMEGYETYPFSNGVTLAEIVEIDPDLIFLDNWMPNRTGAEICSEIKNDPTTQHIPVIILSTNNNLENIALACKADSFLEKPFDIDNVIEMVKTHTQ